MMKKVLSISLFLCVCLGFFTGCNAEYKEAKKLADYAKSLNETTYNAISTDEMSIYASSNGATLIITCTYGSDAASEDAALEALDASDSVYQAVLTSVRASNVGCEAVVIEYKNKSGKVLASRKYK